MLTLVEAVKEKRDLQQRFVRTLGRHLDRRVKRTIGWRGESIEAEVLTNGHIWFKRKKLTKADGGRIPRYWNAFGLLPEQGNLHIAVEINIATESNTENIAGFFAREPKSGQVLLMHSGKIGGGGEGVGKSAFLSWSMLQRVSVTSVDGNERLGVIVAPIDAPNTVDRLAQFIERVAEFKEAVKTGKTDSKIFQERVKEYERYQSEFSGHKSGMVKAELDYLTRHGDVVAALFQERSAVKKASEKIFNNIYLDLYVKREDTLTEVYEIKTDASRQTLYKAIGQLLVNAGPNPTKVVKTMLLPKGLAIPKDIKMALATYGIQVRLFSLTHTSVKLH
jgi:hypothetical protein